MQTGELDQQVEFFSPSYENEGGELIQNWASQGLSWAKVKSQRGNEAFEAARTNARDVLRVKVRFRADVETDWQLQYGGQRYNITAVDRTQRRAGELWLTAEGVSVQ